MVNDRWALLTMSYEQIPGGYKVTTTTDAPCHKWLRYSWTPPRKHPRATIVRGLTKMSDTYLCFVVYLDIEQNEPGDTLTHTFNLTVFDVASYQYQAVWFYFWGEIAGVKSPSETCLFIKAFERLYENYWPAWDSALGLELPNRAAQSFVSPYPHRVSKVEVWLAHRGIPCTIQFAIHRADANLFPIEPPMTAGLYLFPDTDPGWVFVRAWVHFDVPALVNLVPFCIVGHGITGGAYNAQWRGTTAGAYANGQASRCVWPGVWVALPGFDLNFEEWGYPEN